jgi:hydrogen cyanide synthase HcnC
VQSKGWRMPEYAQWTVQAAASWSHFAELLIEQTGIDPHYRHRGGFHLTLGEAEWTARRAVMERLMAQPGTPSYGFEMMDHAQVKRLLPAIGPEVSGGSFTALDGDCNSLKLFRALNAGMQQLGVQYRSEAPVSRIDRVGGEFRLQTAGGELRAAKVVLTAGNGNAGLGPMVGLDVRVRPQRGQIIVTEKAAPFLPYPVSTVRQTDEGGVLVGDSREEETVPVVGTPILSVMADRARRMFPLLGQLNVVRSWAALRVMTEDGFPIYQQSVSHPGAFVATCHSGVTLASNHALVLAPLIAEGSLPAARFQVFGTGRFDVQAAA